MYSDLPVSSSSVVTAAVQANLVLLAQGAELIGRLSEGEYNAKVAACFNSTIGGHFRHVIEHYQGVLAALETGDLDYEHRARDTMIETMPEYALGIAQKLQKELLEVSASRAMDRTLRMASETVTDALLVTSLGRELEFLISHTVHHYALMAVIASQHGVTLPSDFGMAPSTLKFQRIDKAACAR
jgi:uncharacterized damage-inducible protein DinB